jgi:hypothetical protein
VLEMGRLSGGLHCVQQVLPVFSFLSHFHRKFRDLPMFELPPSRGSSLKSSERVLESLKRVILVNGIFLSVFFHSPACLRTHTTCIDPPFGYALSYGMGFSLFVFVQPTTMSFHRSLQTQQSVLTIEILKQHICPSRVSQGLI